MSEIFKNFESQIQQRVLQECEKLPDPSHDYLHVLRVVKTAEKLARLENANLDVVLPAAYLHDVVLVSKSDPRRSIASRLSAEEATVFLRSIGYPQELIPQIAHAVEAHSFSANIPAQTLEARVVQDADRLDGLGAIGIARCFCLTGVLNRPFYAEQDPFAEERPLDDKTQSLDHFFTKLFKLKDRLQTDSGRREGKLRTNYVEGFVNQLRNEIL